MQSTLKYSNKQNTICKAVEFLYQIKNYTDPHHKYCNFHHQSFVCTDEVLRTMGITILGIWHLVGTKMWCHVVGKISTIFWCCVVQYIRIHLQCHIPEDSIVHVCVLCCVFKGNLIILLFYIFCNVQCNIIV